MDLCGSILLGCEDIVVPYVQTRVPQLGDIRRGPDGTWPVTAFGVVRRGNLIGGAIYHQYRPQDGDIMVSVAFDRPDWCLPGTVRALFDYPFNQLGCERITAAVGRHNKRSRRTVEGLGFKLEGVCRKALGRKEDLMLYGILKSECRFLNGQINTTAAARA